MKEDEMDPEYLMFAEAFNSAWIRAEKTFMNADAVDMLEVGDNIRETIHTLRENKKKSLSPDVVNAYNYSIYVVKELLAKLPKRTLRI
jgi:hypothetical protein